MKYEVIAATIVVALGTYLLRALPLGFALSKRYESNAGKLGNFLALAAPSLIAAFLVVSVVPAEFAPGELIRKLVALCAVFLAYRRWANLGVSVIVGVIAYALLNVC